MGGSNRRTVREQLLLEIRAHPITGKLVTKYRNRLIEEIPRESLASPSLVLEISLTSARILFYFSLCFQHGRLLSPCWEAVFWTVNSDSPGPNEQFPDKPQQPGFATVPALVVDTTTTPSILVRIPAIHQPSEDSSPDDLAGEITAAPVLMYRLLDQRIEASSRRTTGTC
jgi:hypothetical protein